jgi:uncharacterized membrane protein YeaQ/YmgE (transglycosylase-associated protein family)
MIEYVYTVGYAYEKKEHTAMMNLILWLVFGTLVGWLAGLVMNDRAGTPLNIVIGIIGALIGGLVTGYSTITQNVFNLTSLLVSFIGAVILLAIVKLVRRITARSV